MGESGDWSRNVRTRTSGACNAGRVDSLGAGSIDVALRHCLRGLVSPRGAVHRSGGDGAGEPGAGPLRAAASVPGAAVCRGGRTDQCRFPRRIRGWRAGLLERQCRSGHPTGSTFRGGGPAAARSGTGPGTPRRNCGGDVDCCLIQPRGRGAADPTRRGHPAGPRSFGTTPPLARSPGRGRRRSSGSGRDHTGHAQPVAASGDGGVRRNPQAVVERRPGSVAGLPPHRFGPGFLSRVHRVGRRPGHRPGPHVRAAGGLGAGLGGCGAVRSNGGAAAHSRRRGPPRGGTDCHHCPDGAADAFIRGPSP